MIELFAPLPPEYHHEECVQRSEAIPVRQKNIRSTDSSWDSIIWI